MVLVLINRNGTTEWQWQNLCLNMYLQEKKVEQLSQKLTLLIESPLLLCMNVYTFKSAMHPGQKSCMLS